MSKDFLPALKRNAGVFFVPVILIAVLAPQGWAGIKTLILIFTAFYLVPTMIMFAMAGKYRRPGETMWQCLKRYNVDLNERSRHREAHRGEFDWDTDWGYRYLTLGCGHIIFEYFPKVPEVGDTYWCYGHGRFGPAQEHEILHVDQFPESREKGVLLK